MLAFVGDSCVCAQDVDGAEVLLGLLDAGCYGGFVGDVALDVEDVGRLRRRVEGSEIVGCDVAARRCSTVSQLLESHVRSIAIAGYVPRSSSTIAEPMPPRAPVTKA